MHARVEPPAAHRSLDEDLDDLAQYFAAAERIAPANAELLADTIARIRARSGPADPQAPGHGAFRLDQVHASAAGARLIDLDSYCWAEPARDLGNLFAYLRWRAIRKPGLASLVADVRAAFVAGYASDTISPPDERRVRAFEAVSLLKIAGRRYRALSAEEWPLVPSLIEAASGQLDDSGGTA